jgi:hypothetical protein
MLLVRLDQDERAGLNLDLLVCDSHEPSARDNDVSLFATRMVVARLRASRNAPHPRDSETL